MNSNSNRQISIWFFIGALLTIYGVLILYSGLTSPAPPGVVLSELHAAVWWGVLLLIIGGGYSIYFFPGKR